MTIYKLLENILTPITRWLGCPEWLVNIVFWLVEKNNP